MKQLMKEFPERFLGCIVKTVNTVSHAPPNCWQDIHSSSGWNVCDTDSVSPAEQMAEILADRLGVLKPRIVFGVLLLLRLRWLPVSDLTDCHQPDFDCPMFSLCQF